MNEEWIVDVSYIKDWIKSLNEDDYKCVVTALQRLREVGPTLGRPFVDTISGSTYKNMKELRPRGTKDTNIRILFAFDLERHAIMLCAGDKTNEWKKWYTENIPIAEERFTNHLKEIRNNYSGDCI